MARSDPSSEFPVSAGSSGCGSDAQSPDNSLTTESSASTANDLEARVAALEQLACDLREDPQALLRLLRRLEQLHRSIQDGPFRASLPSGRNELFRLLEDMEHSGGWPYIPRLQLRTFMDLLQGPGTEAPPPPPQSGQES